MVLILEVDELGKGKHCISATIKDNGSGIMFIITSELKLSAFFNICNRFANFINKPSRQILLQKICRRCASEITDLIGLPSRGIGSSCIGLSS